MHYSVEFTADATRDMEEIVDYILSHDLPGKADYVLDKLESACNSLAQFPDRGSYPKELLNLGIREYREIYFKPYRIIYKTTGKKIHIYLVIDGRRDAQSLLQQRLLCA